MGRFPSPFRLVHRVFCGELSELINSGRLPSQRFGNAQMINEGDLKLVEDHETGRPPKAKLEAIKVGKKGGRR